MVAPAPAWQVSKSTFNWHASAQSRLPACTRRLNEVHGGRRRILLDGFHDFPPGALHTQRTWMLTQTDACLSRHPTHGLRRVDDGPNRRMVNGSTVASIRVDGMPHSEKKDHQPTGQQTTHSLEKYASPLPPRATIHDTCISWIESSMSEKNAASMQTPRSKYGFLARWRSC